MPTATRPTDLSVTWTDEETGAEKHVLAVGDTFRATLGFDVTSADDGAATDVACVVTRLDTNADVTAATVEAQSVVADEARITVSGFARGVTYELQFTTTYANGRLAPRTFVIDCVA